MKQTQVLNHSIVVDLNILIHSSLQKVWEYLVTPKHIKEYLFGTDTISDWTVGSEIRFVGEWEGKSYEDKGKILVFDAPLEFSYSYYSGFSNLPDLPENYSKIIMKLTEDTNGILLSLTQIGFGSVEQQKHSEENWKNILKTIKQMAENIS
ncbi:SRPBCC domain-containing protein [Leptospira kemamanensis]|uniref:SRPBCC domain-containing protein n=1 Tax=Leptospira kemamanensis TaxID=2484942 RepID=A0A4R9JWW4_9LEPT|nr:SRPBCC domain-containing protein [Leptospira kemamanensis]TGL56952.1 SRPBCC domain-containing protein [Leptospira kemamanensis]